MRATDIIRAVIDIIDAEQRQPEITIIKTPDHKPEDAEQERKQNQIKDLKPTALDNQGDYANSPAERISDVDSVTKDAGGGMQGPKHPADIRGEHPSLFSDYLRKLESKE